MTPAFRALVRKDIRLFLNDRRAVIMSFIAPVVIGAFFGYIFGGLGGQTETSRIRVLISDADNSAVSRAIASRLAGDKNLDVAPSDPATARETVRKGKAAVAVLIPKDFGVRASKSLFTGNDKPSLSLLYDPSRGPEKGMVQGLLTGALMQAVSTEVFSGANAATLTGEQLADIENSTGLAPDEKASLSRLMRGVIDWQNTSRSTSSAAPRGLGIPGEFAEEAVTARRGAAYNGYAHSFGGMGVQFILLMGIDVGIGLLLQRQRGLWKRFRAAPLSRALLLGSRTLSATLIATVIMCAIFAVARLLFGVRIEGSVGGFLLIAFAFSLMTAAFGLTVASLGRTPEATRGLAAFITLIMVMLGGAWVPTFIFPEWLQKLTVVFPTRWAVDGLDGVVWRGYHFADALAPTGVLLLYAAVFGVIAVRNFRWEAES